MRVEEAFSEAFSYAKDFTGDIGRLIILAILGIIPIINFIVLGYACKVIRQTPTSNSPPKLEEFLNMWIDGLKVVVVGIIYMIIPILIISAGLISTKTGFMRHQPVFFFSILSFIGSITFLVGLALAFLLSIILVIGVVHMIKTGNFSKAFAVGEILGIIGGIGWSKYLIWLIVVFILEVIVFTIGNIPLIGWIILMFVTPILAVFIARSITILYSEVQQETAKSII